MTLVVAIATAARYNVRYEDETLKQVLMIFVFKKSEDVVI